jgi:hypothetical protein
LKVGCPEVDSCGFHKGNCSHNVTTAPFNCLSSLSVVYLSTFSLLMFLLYYKVILRVLGLSATLNLKASKTVERNVIGREV